MNCKHEKLPPDISLSAIWSREDIAQEWNEVEQTLEQLGIPDETGGVNPGDRRAIYYLLRHFKPSRLLEVGTHIGASTVYAATALEPDALMVSVDISDVNSQERKPWLQYKTPHSPAEMIQSLGLQKKVQFVISSSMDYLNQDCGDFNFIFLDGDHDKKTVHQEIPVALEKLTPGGAILLHDYFPDNKPIWPDYWAGTIEGPYLAVERLRSEGCRIRAIPLGELPWPTTLNSNLTNLAILVQD
jgi:predicted O-methyltransferase YrrM